MARSSGTGADLAETFELHAEARTRIVREVRRLGNLNEPIANVESGDVEVLDQDDLHARCPQIALRAR